MRRNTMRQGDKWAIGLWLVFKSTGDVRLAHTEPALDSNERAMFITAYVPFSLFRTPQLRGTITLSEAGGEPAVINLAAAEAALTEALGAAVELTIKGAEGPMSACNNCGERYPSTPEGTIHKCGRCSGGMCYPEKTA